MEEQCDILRRRAAILAEPPEQVLTEKTIQVVEFLLSSEVYAFELNYVKKVIPLKDVVLLPGTPSFIYGITNYLGQIVSVLDLRMFFELPTARDGKALKIIVLQSQHMQVAVLAEEIIGVKECIVSQLQTDLPTLTGVRSRYLKGVSPQQTILLDVVSLLSDESLIVQ